MRARTAAVTLVALVGALATPPLAGAALVYQKSIKKTSVWIAGDDGSAPRRLVTGALPRISPDGSAVAYLANAGTAHPSLREIPAAGGPVRTLVERWRFGVFAWSADGRYVASLAGDNNGKARLVLVDRTTGTRRTVDRGYFAGASFSPASDELVYSYAARETLFPKANLRAVPVAGGAFRRVTSDGRSLYPLWGPQRIAHVRYSRPTGRFRKQDGPKFNIWTVAGDGSARAALTRDNAPFLLTGLVPLAWSADGSRLLALFQGQDIVYPVSIDPATGKQRVVGRRKDAIFPTALSKDGSTVLGFTGFLGVGRVNVVTVPYAGGTPRVLVAKAENPDWNR